EDDRVDLAIPGEKYSFGTLEKAQALGDFAALCDRRRRALRLHVRQGTDGLRLLLEAARSF
ncbi:hypothetical protein ABTH62_19480, partial [Acinetobacter baumannii]